MVMMLLFRVVLLLGLCKVISSDLIDIAEHHHDPTRRQDLKSIFWMHIQKTSSWLGDFLIVWACPEFCRHELHHRAQHKHQATGNNHSLEIEPFYSKVDKHFKIKKNDNDMILKSSLMNCSVNFKSYHQGYGWHVPYKNKEMKNTVVTLFRKPSSRIISAYLFNIMLPAGLPNREDSQKIYHAIKSSSIPIHAYATTPGIASCQTKMMLGYFCGEDRNISTIDVNEAKRRVREDLYFFGLTEEPEASANLFLAMHSEDGAKPYRKRLEELVDPPFSFSSTRANSKHSKESHASLLEQLASTGWKDELDEIIYAQASRIFYRRCKEHEIATKFKSIEELMSHLHL
jgi:hypothetical protein